MHKFTFTYRLFKDLNQFLGGYYLCYYASPEDDFYSWQCFTKSQIIFIKKQFPIFEVIQDPPIKKNKEP